MKYLPLLPLIFLMGCTQSPESGGQVVSEGNSLITPSQALMIGLSSPCVEEGELTGNLLYNGNSKTWWIDMVVEDHEGCAPACVVSEETETAEINWRCTGLAE